MELLPISIFQSTKANHNDAVGTETDVDAVANLNISKYESKSQRDRARRCEHVCCCQSQYFKVRKQITTYHAYCTCVKMLLPISIFQSTKANHNSVDVATTAQAAVANLNISKYESKSQPAWTWLQQPKPLLPISIFQSTKANHN